MPGKTTAAPNASQLPLDKLVVDPKLQSRAKFDQDFVDELVERYQAKTNDIPPIEVFEVDGRPHIVDGFHRFKAAKEAGYACIHSKTVGEGTFADAVWYAVSANQTQNGLRRTIADKRKAVIMALEGIGHKPSSRAIAEHVGVHHSTVSKIRDEWEAQQREGEALSSDDNAPEPDGGALAKTDNAPEYVQTKDGRKYPKRRKPKSSDDDVPDVAGKKADEPTDRHAKIARMIQSLRQNIKGRFGPHQTIDGHLEKAWRAADDLVPVDCSRCDGGGCEFCKRGRTTKGEDRAAGERTRSEAVARKARAEA